MSNTIKTILENLDKLGSSTEQIQEESNLDNSLTLLENEITSEWTEFKKINQLNEAPGDQSPPPGAAAPGKTVDPKTVATIGKIRAITKNLRLVPSVAGAAVAKQVAGIRPNPNELKQLGTLDQTIGAAAKQALLNPKQSGITLNAITQAARAAQAQQGKK